MREEEEEEEKKNSWQDHMVDFQLENSFLVGKAEVPAISQIISNIVIMDLTSFLGDTADFQSW